jgi:hypothetical protein
MLADDRHDDVALAGDSSGCAGGDGAFGQANPNQVVSLRPYAGGGFSYSTVSSSIRTTSSPIGVSGSGFGQQAFGGIEMSFADYPSLTISNEFTYYRLPSTSTTSSTIDGLNYLVAVHFYLK